MRWKEINEYVEEKDIINLKKKALEYAMDYEQGCFSLVEPVDTGLPYSIFISSCKEYPVIIIDYRPGKHFDPDGNSEVLLIGEYSTDPTLNEFLSNNKEALKKQCRGKKYDYKSFMDDMKSVITEGKISLNEMVNYAKGRFGSPLAFWIRPEPNPLSHEARIKVNNNYKNEATTNDCFIITLQPNSEPTVMHDHSRVKSKDLKTLAEWINKHKQTFIAFYKGDMSFTDFDSYLENNPIVKTATSVSPTTLQPVTTANIGQVTPAVSNTSPSVTKVSKPKKKKK